MWQTSPLTSACTVFADGDWIESKDQSLAGVRLVQTGNVGEGDFKDRAEKARFISHDTFTRLRCTEIFAGDCLISRLPDPVGRACLIPETGERMITAVDCTIARFDQSQLLPEFFVYYTQSGDYLAAVERDATGTTRKRISRARLGQIPIPLAPLSEQRRIVAILDEAIEGIATAKVHAEKSLRNAREGFSAVLASFFPSSRAEVTLVELADSISDGDHAPPPKAKDGVPFITISNIDKAIRQIDFVDTFLVPRSYFEGLKAHRRPVAGDVLYTVTGSFGIPVLVTGEQEFCFQRHIGLIRPKPTVDAAWLTYALLSPMAFAQADQRATGTAQRTVSLSVLRDLRLPRLPADEQRRVAAEIATLESRTRELEDCFARKLAALDELKQSLLHQAFSGAL